MVAADCAQKRPKSERKKTKKNEILKWRAVKHRLWGREVFFFFHSAVLQECHSQPGQNELEQWSTGLDLSTSRVGQSAPFDGAADIEQLPLWAALRERCYRSMGHTLVTPPNSFSTLSKQRSLCIYLHGEVVLHNSSELPGSDLQARHRVQVKSKFGHTACGLRARFIERWHSFCLSGRMISFHIFEVFTKWNSSPFLPSETNALTKLLLYFQNDTLFYVYRNTLQLKITFSPMLLRLGDAGCY